MSFGKKFLIVTGIQIVCLFGMIGYKYTSLARGREIILEVPRPKDPRSLFSGDYVIIRYAINNLDMDKIPGDVYEPNWDDVVYVELRETGGVWKPVRIYSEKPENVDMFIRGKVKDVEGNMLRVEYGIESKYVPEGTGGEMEDRLREVRKAIVRIDPSGHGSVIGVPEE